MFSKSVLGVFLLHFNLVITNGKRLGGEQRGQEHESPPLRRRHRRHLQQSALPEGDDYYELSLIGASGWFPDLYEYYNGEDVMFVPYYQSTEQNSTKIHLKTGDPFMVTDANAFDNNGGTFQLPDPSSSTTTTTPDTLTMVNVMETPTYSAWIRAQYIWFLSRRNGSAKVNDCEVKNIPDAEDEVWCFLGNIIMTPETVQDATTGAGGMNTNDISSLVMNVCVGEEGATNVFDAANEGAFWASLDENTGVRLMKVRFYSGEVTMKDPMCSSS